MTTTDARAPKDTVPPHDAGADAPPRPTYTQRVALVPRVVGAQVRLVLECGHSAEWTGWGAAPHPRYAVCTSCRLAALRVAAAKKYVRPAPR